MSQQFNVSPDNLWMAMDYTPTSKTVVNWRLHSLTWDRDRTPIEGSGIAFQNHLFAGRSAR
jgi:hypothetical protein